MGRAPCCDKANVKKGPWSPEEDARLKSYIHQNGTGGNWIALPQKIGLKRCGKSCRLRWLNYLRPNIKHGGFSEEEDNIICSLYITIGSRWSIIAAQLPGRTDNDIKNYWNTRLKKKLLGKQRKDHHHQHQRAGTRSSRLNHPSAADHNPPPMVLEFPPPPDHHHHDPMAMMMMMKMMDHDQLAAHHHWLQLPAGTTTPLPDLAADHHHDEEFNLGEMLEKLQGQNHGNYNYDQVNSAAPAMVMNPLALSPNSSVSIDTSSSTGAITNPSTSTSSSLLFHGGQLPQEIDGANFHLAPDGGDDDQLLDHLDVNGFEGWYGYQSVGAGATSSESTGATTWGNNDNIYDNATVAGSDLLLHGMQGGGGGGFHQLLPPMEDSSIYFSPPQ